MTTSGACARAATGNSAALAVAPSNRCRRLMVIAISPACPALSMKRLTSTVKPQRTAVAAYESIMRFPDHALHHSELLVAQVRHQHQARRMRDRKRQLRRRNHRLRRHTARPEYRKLVGRDRHGVAIIRFCDIRDPDRMRKTEMDRRTVHRGKARGDLYRADRLRRLVWPHRHHHRTGERPGSG